MSPEEREMLLEMSAVSELVREAVAAERERCVRVVEGLDDPKHWDVLRKRTADIVAAIRGGQS